MDPELRNIVELIRLHMDPFELDEQGEFVVDISDSTRSKDPSFKVPSSKDPSCRDPSSKVSRM